MHGLDGPLSSTGLIPGTHNTTPHRDSNDPATPQVHVPVTLQAVAPLADTPWPMFRHDRQHTGRSPNTGPSIPQEKWSYDAGGKIWSSPAIAADGTVYVGSADDNVYAINPNGTLKWSFTTGNDVTSSPAIAADGTTQVGSLDDTLYALHTDGTLN